MKIRSGEILHAGNDCLHITKIIEIKHTLIAMQQFRLDIGCGIIPLLQNWDKIVKISEELKIMP
jgi:hypothetical protein